MSADRRGLASPAGLVGANGCIDHLPHPRHVEARHRGPLHPPTTPPPPWARFGDSGAPFQYRGCKLQIAGVQAFALTRSGTNLQSLIGSEHTLTIFDGGPPPRAGGDAPPPPPAETTLPSAAGSWQLDQLYGTGTLYTSIAPIAPVSSTVPRLWWLRIPNADLAATRSSVEDFFLLVRYNVT